MINWLKSINPFRKKSTKRLYVIKDAKISWNKKFGILYPVKDNYTIDYYPSTKKYYPKVGNRYIYDRKDGGVSSTHPMLFSSIEGYSSEDDALVAIHKHKRIYNIKECITIEVD